MPRDRPSVNFRVGQQVLDSINTAVETSGKNRSDWILGAIQHQIRTGKPIPVRITAGALLSSKGLIRFKLDRDILEEIDQECARLGVKRTTWLLDACLTKIAENNRS